MHSYVTYQDLFISNFKSKPPTWIIRFKRKGLGDESKAGQFVLASLQEKYRLVKTFKSKDLLGVKTEWELYILAEVENAGSWS
ncbi:MAG: hypothetical protein R3A13_10085 [Bdellovibrionota bacterium]